MTIPRVDAKALAVRVALVGGIAAYLIYIARAVGVASAAPDGYHLSYMAIALAVAPLGAFLAFWRPIIFPFGLYLALAPFDNLLSVTSGATAVRVVGIAAAAAMLTRILLSRKYVLPAPSWYVWFAFVVWCGLGLIWTPDLPESQRVYGIMFQNFMMMTILAIYPLEAKDFRRLASIAVISGVLLAMYEFSELFTGQAKFGERISITTPSGLMIDPNYFAASFLLPIAFALSSALGARSVFLRAGGWASTAFMMGGLLLTGSRGAFVAIALLFAWYAIRSRHRLQVIGVSVCCFALTAFYPTVWERFLKDPGAQGSGSGRTFIWNVGLHIIRDHGLLGTGIGSYPEMYDQYLLGVYQQVFQNWHRPAHDLIIAMWSETGLLGLFLILLAWYLGIRQLNLIPAGHPMHGFRLAMEGALIGLFGGAIFIDTIWLKYVWLAHSFSMLLMSATYPRIPRVAVPLVRRVPIRLISSR